RCWVSPKKTPRSGMMNSPPPMPTMPLRTPMPAPSSTSSATSAGGMGISGPRPGCADRYAGRSSRCDAQTRLCAARRAPRHASAARSSCAPSRFGLVHLAVLTTPRPRHSLAFRLQHGQEGLLRDLHRAHLLHPLLALLLLLEELALPADVATVALGEHVLAHRGDGLTGDDPAADGRLDRHLVHLLGNDLFQARTHVPAALVGAIPVHDDAE